MNMEFASFIPINLYNTDEQYKIYAEILCSGESLKKLLSDTDVTVLNHTIEEIMSRYAAGMIFEGEFICKDQSKMLIHSDYKMSFLNIWTDQSINDVFIRTNGPKMQE